MGQIEVIINLRGRTQVVKVVHHLKGAKRRLLEKRQVETGMGIVVKRVESYLRMDDLSIEKFRHQRPPRMIMRQCN